MELKNIAELAERVHTANERWWRDPATGALLDRDEGELCMLIVSELSEAMEGARKSLMDDKLPHRSMLEVEIADALIRVLDTYGHYARTWKDFTSILSAPRDVDTLGFTTNVGSNLIEIVACVVSCRWSMNRHRNTQMDDSAFDLAQNMLDLIDELTAFAVHHNLDLIGAFEEKMAYNATRHDHTNEARLAEGGKRW